MKTDKTKRFMLKLLCLTMNLVSSCVFADSPAANAVKPLPQDGKMHLYLCGTGVPVLYMQKIRKPSCLAVIADNQFLLFDAGEGSIQTLAAMDLPYTKIYNVFITHWHSDHFAGLAQVSNGSWTDGRDQPLNVYGPYGVKQILQGLRQAYQFDTLFRSINSQNKLDPTFATPVPHLIDAVSQDQVVYQNNGLKIIAFEVNHLPVYPAVGYRIQYKSCHITISGDTKVIPKEVDEAKNADVFISEALNVQQTQVLANTEKAAGNITKYNILEDIPNYHSDTLLLAKTAQQAQVKNLVLTHLDPPPNITEKSKNQFIIGMAQYYKGPIIVGDDGDELVLTPNNDGNCQFEYIPITSQVMQ
ncbi:MAG: MBL fold metallo-hydrolase [Gammaproteobacteria bacterium]